MWYVGGGFFKILENVKISWKRVEISSISALKNLWWRVGGWFGWCIYDYNISLSPNLWLLTFNLDLHLTIEFTHGFRQILNLTSDLTQLNCRLKCGLNCSLNPWDHRVVHSESHPIVLSGRMLIPLISNLGSIIHLFWPHYLYLM